MPSSYLATEPCHEDRLVYSLYVDGSSNMFAGIVGVGAVLYDPQNNLVWSKKTSQFEVCTSTQVEYMALIFGMWEAAEHGVKHLDIHGDCQTMIQHMKGLLNACKSVSHLHLTAKNAALRFDSVNYKWISRLKNKKADAEARAALRSLYSNTQPQQEQQIHIPDNSTQLETDPVTETQMEIESEAEAELYKLNNVTTPEIEAETEPETVTELEIETDLHSLDNSTVRPHPSTDDLVSHRIVIEDRKTNKRRRCLCFLFCWRLFRN